MAFIDFLKKKNRPQAKEKANSFISSLKEVDSEGQKFGPRLDLLEPEGPQLQSRESAGKVLAELRPEELTEAGQQTLPTTREEFIADPRTRLGGAKDPVFDLLEKIGLSKGVKEFFQEPDIFIPEDITKLGITLAKERGESITDFQRELAQVAGERKNFAVGSIIDPIPPGGEKIAKQFPDFIASQVKKRVARNKNVSKIVSDAAKVRKSTLNLKALKLKDSPAAQELVAKGTVKPKLSFREVSKEAEKLNISHEQIIEMGDSIIDNPGAAQFSDVFIAKARSLYNKNITQLDELRKVTKAKPKNVGAATKYADELAKNYELTVAIENMNAAAGRKLSLLRFLKQDTGTADKARAKILRSLPKEEALKVNKLILEAGGDTSKVRTILAKYSQANWWDKTVEYSVNAMLSNPKTHVRNIMGTSINALAKVMRMPIAVGVDLGRAVATGTKRRRFFGEIPAALKGLGGEGLQKAKKGVTKDIKALARGEEITPVRGDEFGFLPAIRGTKGKVLRKPTQMLTVEDRFFTNLLKEQEASRFKLLEKKGVKIKNVEKRIEEEVSEALFQADLGPVGKSMQKFINETPGLKLLLPFFKTPLNIIKEGVAHTPAGFATELLRPMFTKGMKTNKVISKNADQVVDNLSKAVLGTSITLPLMNWATQENEDGLPNITGAPPRNAAERETFFRNQQPYSIRVGDKYYSYRDMEPFSLLFTTVAKGTEDYKKTGDLSDSLAAASGEMVRNMADKASLKTLGDIYQAIFFQSESGAGDRILDFFQERASLAIPNVVSSFGRGIDPTIREPETFTEEIKTLIPGLSKQVRPKRDVFGDAVKREGGLAGATINPFTSKTIPTDSDLEQELRRLKVDFSPVPGTIDGIKLTADGKNEFSAIRGPILKKAVTEMISNPQYDRLTDRQKEDNIKKLFNNVNKSAKEIFSVVGSEEIRESIKKSDKNAIKVFTELYEKDPRYQDMSSKQLESLVRRNLDDIKEQFGLTD